LAKSFQKLVKKDRKLTGNDRTESKIV
jgi:hypothetical protein